MDGVTMEIECQLCRKEIATTKLYGYHTCSYCKDFFDTVTIEQDEEDGLSYIWTWNNTLYTVYGETFYMKVGLTDEQYKRFTNLQQEPCISCGHTPAGGIYHDMIPCCIECYLNDSLVKLLQQQEIRAQANWIDEALREAEKENFDD